MSKHRPDNKTLTDDERQQLRIWMSASPLQRLAWLEDAQKIANKSGALARYGRLKASDH